jgi:DNA polymerase-3 subunit gamma/tau
VAAAGGVDEESTSLTDLVDAIAGRDPGRVLAEVAAASSAGRDPRRLGTELLEHLRDGFLAVQAPSLVLLPDEAAAAAAEQARRLGVPTLVRAMEVIGQALIDMREAPDPRITLEVALVRLSAPDADDSRSSLLERVERLERLLGERGDPAAASSPAVRSTPPPPAPEVRAPAGSPPPVTAGAGQSALGAHRKPREAAGAPPPAVSPAAPAPAPAPTAALAEPRPTPEVRPSGEPLPTREQLTVAWGDTILPALRPGVRIYLSSGRFLGVDESTATFAVPDKGLLGRAEPNRPEVEAALAAHFGRRVPLRLVLDDVPGPAPRPEPAAEDPSAIDLDDLQDAPAAVASPEQRLLEAFPGAEEVSP